MERLSTFPKDLPDCVRNLKEPRDRSWTRPALSSRALSSQDSLARVVYLGTPSEEPVEGTGNRPSPAAMVLLAPVPDHEGVVYYDYSCGSRH